MENLHSSDFWLQHFQENRLNKRVDWSKKPRIKFDEIDLIIPSLKAWQLGETSDGLHLKAAVAKYAKRHQDPVYNDVMDLFIKEEQKHGANLGAYLDAIGQERKQHDIGDSLFRKIRGLNRNMEIWTITVLIVESAAQVYYQAIKEATACPLLRDICTDILIDEADHIRFQRERLAIIFNRKNAAKKNLAFFIYHLHFKLTYRAIWLGHKKAFKAGGYDYSRFKRLMHHKFDINMRYLIDVSEQNLSPINF